MAILKIARMGHPILFQQAHKIDNPTVREVGELIGNMIDTMEDASGAGLAAPQVHVSLRLVMFHVPLDKACLEDGEAGEGCPFTVLINPKIEVIDEELIDGREACLSLPGLAGVVPRYKSIQYFGQDHLGNNIDRKAQGYHARVVQHECDHLDGVLYPMRMKDLSTLTFTSEMFRKEVGQ